MAAAMGDRAALAAIYDRYADRLYDFCVGMLRDREAAADCVQDVFVTAATKLGQLREAEKLRPWLYAIARSECLATIRGRKREQPTEEVPEMPSLDASPETLAARADIADLIRDVSGGLSDRDRVVLELAYRQGLAGPELADALGVTARNANTLVERLRDTVGRSLGALLLSRRAKANMSACPELSDLVADWDGAFTVLLRKRTARHIDDCAVCENDRARTVNPAALLAATPVVVPAPAWLRERTLDQAIEALPHTSPNTGQSWWPPKNLDISDLSEAGPDTPPPNSRPRRGRASIGAILLVLGAGGAILLATPRGDVTPADIPAREVSDTSVLPTSPTTAIPRTVSTEPLPPPATMAPTTTEPAPAPVPIPRTQQSEPTTQTQAPEVSRAPSTTVTRPTTPRTTAPKTAPVQIEPSEVAPPTKSTPKKVPSVPKVPGPPKSPDDNTGGGAVFN